MTRERGSILATNRGLRRMRNEIIGLTILAVSCGDSPTRPRVPDPPVQPAPAAPTPAPTPAPTRRRRRPRPRPCVDWAVARRPGRNRLVHRTRDVRRRLRTRRHRHLVMEPTIQSSVVANLLHGSGSGAGTRPGEGMVGASLGGRPASMRVFVLEAGTFKLAGVVSETHGQTLPGVSIDVIGGTGRGLHTTTDMNGRYTLYGVAGRVQLRASADGLAAVTREVEVLSDSESDAFVRVSIECAGRHFGPMDDDSLTSGELPGRVSGDCDGTNTRSASRRLARISRSRRAAQLSKCSIRMRTTARSSSAPRCGSPSSATPNTAAGAVPDSIDHLSATETLEFDGTVVGTVTESEIRARLDGDLVFWDHRFRSSSPSWYCRNANHLVTLRRQP